MNILLVVSPSTKRFNNIKMLRLTRSISISFVCGMPSLAHRSLSSRVVQGTNNINNKRWTNSPNARCSISLYLTLLCTSTEHQRAHIILYFIYYGLIKNWNIYYTNEMKINKSETKCMKKNETHTRKNHLKEPKTIVSKSINMCR